MHHGRQQIMGFSQETVYGTPVTPASVMGIVTGGSVKEGLAVTPFMGTELKTIQAQRYGAIECGAQVRMLTQYVAAMSGPCVRAPYFAYKQHSYTIDCGVHVGGAVLSRRLVGSKLANLKLNISVDEPMETEMTWISQYVTDGAAAGYSPATSPLWVPEGIIVTYDNEVVADLQELTIEIDNNLRPKYLLNRQASNPRSLAWIDEGPQIIRLGMKSFDRFPPAARGLVPLHGVGGFNIMVTLSDLCSYDNAVLQFLGCYQPSVEEPFSPMEPVEYACELTAQSFDFS